MPGSSYGQQTRNLGSSMNRQSLTGHQRVSSPPPSEDTRDRIICMYKEEIRVQGARDRDFEHLQTLIADLEKRTQALQGRIEDGQRDHEERLSQQSKLITHHQQDIENLKRGEHERQQEGLKVYDEI